MTMSGDISDGEPFKVVMNCHLPGRGYSLSIVTRTTEMQVYVSEKGRTIQAYDSYPSERWARELEEG